MNILEECIDLFSSLPGVGKKTASRYVIYLLKSNKKELLRFHELLTRAVHEMRECPECHAIIGSDECKFCNPQRSLKGSICIVQDFRDLLAIEQTGKYHGTYHVLGGLISPLDGIGPTNLNIQSLEKRLKEWNYNEIIFALGTTRESETTQFYLYRKFQSLVPNFSALPKGISYGIELEFADEQTLGSAIENRVPVS